MRIRNKFEALIVTGMLALAGIGSACMAEPIDARIGVIASLSGNWSAFGDMTLKGAELAQQELARHQSVRIFFEIEDSHEDSSGSGAVTAYRALKNKGLALFLGPAGTPGGLALAPVIAKDATIVISPSVAVEAFHRSGKNIFNSQGAFEVASRLLAQQAFRDGARNIAIFASQHPYESTQANAFAEEFIRLGGKLLVRVDPLPETTNLRGEALRIVQAKPDAVFFAVYNQLALASKELKQLGFKKAKYAPLMDRSRFDGAQGGLSELIFTKLGETNSEFIKSFHARFGRDPDYPAEFAHDAVLALGHAIAQTRSIDPSLLLPVLSKIKFSGASGEFRFDDDGCVVRRPTLWRVRDEKFESITEERSLTIGSSGESAANG